MDNILENKISDIFKSYSDNVDIKFQLYSNFKPTKKNHKDLGHISTPSYIITDLVNKLIELHNKEYNNNIFSDPNINIFDPCCGFGGMPLEIFDKRYNALKEVIPDKKIRCSHIIKTLYYSDITPLNINITTEVLKQKIKSICGLSLNNSDFNYNIGNSINLDILKIWGIKMNIILMNPPYNDSTKGMGVGHKPYLEFLKNALCDWIKPNGYVLNISPAIWRNIDHPMFKLISHQNQIKYLEIHSEKGPKGGIVVFGCATRYDLSIIKVCECYENSIIIGEDNKEFSLNLKEWNFIPNMMYDKIIEIINNPIKCDFGFSRSCYASDKPHINTHKTDEYKHPIIYTVNKEGLNLWYSSIIKYDNLNNPIHFNRPKFVMSNGVGFYCDYKGDYGLSQFSYCIFAEESELDNIKKVFENKEFQQMVKAIKFTSSSYNKNIFKLFNKNFWKDFKLV